MVWVKDVHSFAYGWPVVPAPFAEETLLSLLKVFLLRGHWTHTCRFISGFCVWSVDPCVFLPEPHSVDYCSFVVSFEIVSIREPSSFLFLQEEKEAIWGPLRCSMNFRMDFSSHRAHHGDLGRGLNYVTLGRIDILTILSFPVYAHGMSIYFSHILLNMYSFLAVVQIWV